jgi:NADH-quinone oxidoreductase subunit G
MGNLVTLTIDGQTVAVPEGTLVVDAAKKIGIDIPVFCYHPKMEPVGMCRMCLVEIGRPVVDRATKEVVREPDGSPRLQFGPKLETACTTPVSEGMAVRGMSDKVKAAREEVLEFLLTSHPLDCPVCDKGGECPLQNLTMGFGPGESRFLYDEKMHLAKHVPLGDLIYLDRERCIQCARCVRFQEQVAGEPVIGFYQRGRAIEITTFSEPGFDSVFSGNTTDICPVGALTTADFRFGARPWEMKPAASICSHCPVGCNLTFNVRREARSDGQSVIKRVMPRQNEAVNEIWMCDKGRFAYHFTESKERLTQPLVRDGGELRPASWDEALERAADAIRAAGEDVLALAGGRLSNEDLYNLRQLALGRNGQAVLYASMAGGDLVSQVGVAPGTNLGAMGKGSAILVVASDLQEEAPIWWLRVKQAAERGATLIVANPRATKLDRYAAYSLRYRYGEEAQIVLSLLSGIAQTSAAGKAFVDAQDAVVVFGSEGLGLEGSASLAHACARLLVESGHVGRPNNGLIGVWEHANDQGAWEMGFKPRADLEAAIGSAKVLYAAAADPAGDDPALARAVDAAGFVIAQELFLTETARRADVVFPAQAFTERGGSYTSGERRVQRFYPAVPALHGPRADYEITAQIAAQLSLDMEARAASLVFQRLAADVPAYAGLSYQKISETAEQWPLVGRADLYYGGTGYANQQGLGVQLALTAASVVGQRLPEPPPPAETVVPGEDGLVAYPVTRLYDQGVTVQTSTLLAQRIAKTGIVLHPATAQRLGLVNGETARVRLNGAELDALVKLDESVPEGVALASRSAGLPIRAPLPLHVMAAEMARQA